VPRSGPDNAARITRARPYLAQERRAQAPEAPSADHGDPLAKPMPATTRLAEDPVVLPTVNGVAIRLPDALKSRFRRACPHTAWDRVLRLYIVSGPDARTQVEAWLVRVARTTIVAPKAKAPPTLRLT
jgi:hypothetical protein